jgi:hypothetical protein
LQSKKLNKRVNEQSEFLLSGGFWILFDGPVATGKKYFAQPATEAKKNKDLIFGFRKMKNHYSKSYTMKQNIFCLNTKKAPTDNKWGQKNREQDSNYFN